MAKKTPEINATSTADIAFLLLVFFLATTTMNVDSGIYRRLPPYQPDNTEAPKYAKRNILQVLVNRNNQLAINGELADVSTLKDRTIEFVLNPNNSEDLPQKEIKTIDLFGPVEVSNGIVSLQKAVQRLLTAPVGGGGAGLAHNVALGPDAVRLHIVLVHAVVADEGVGLGNDLAVVAGVGQGLFKAHHTGGKDDFAHGNALSTH